MECHAMVSPSIKFPPLHSPDTANLLPLKKLQESMQQLTSAIGINHIDPYSMALCTAGPPPGSAQVPR